MAEAIPVNPSITPIPEKKPLFEKEKADSSEQFNILASRLRLSEERYGELRKKLVVIEQNMLANHKKSMTEIKAIDSDLSEIKRTIAEVEDRIITIIKELRLTAKKEEVEVLRKYIDLWNPVKFVSADQIEKLVEELVQKKLHPDSEEKP